MLLGIGVLLSLTVFASGFDLQDVAAQNLHRLQKRNWMLDCDDTPVPVERQQFASLNALCKGYPHGFGLICDDHGNPTVRAPSSLIARTYGNDLAHVCLNHCHCSDIAPDAPTIQEALDAQMSECSVSNDTAPSQNAGHEEEPMTSASCPRTSNSALANSCACNEYWYGRPVNADCLQAMRRLPDHGSTTQKLREFLANGQTPHHVRGEGPPVQMPIISTYGQCSVAVLLPEGPATTPSMVVDTLQLNQAAEELREHCVQSGGQGGKFHQSSGGREDELSELPDIVMYAPNSKWKDFLELKYQCIVDTKGNSRCRSSPKPIPRTKNGAYGAWKYMGTIGKQGWVQIHSKDGNKRKCGGSCLNPTDCDVDSDCLCASTKGMFLSSTWGQHSCTYVAGAAAAIAAAAIKQPVCRSRCLLQQKETLASGSPSNATNTTFLSFDLVGRPENVSYPSPTEVGSEPAAPIETASTTVVLGNTTSLEDNDGGSPESTSPQDEPGYSAANTTGNDNNTYPDNYTPNMSNDTDPFAYGNATIPAYAIFNDSSPEIVDPLTCPCNCTYTSAACCLSDSGIVYEPPSMKVPVDPIPDDEPICCDPRSGQFLWRSSGECSGEVVNGTARNFIDLGGRLWNSTFSNPVGFPDEENGNVKKKRS